MSEEWPIPQLTVKLEREGRWLWRYVVTQESPYRILALGSAFGRERARRKAARVTAHPERYFSEVSL